MRFENSEKLIIGYLSYSFKNQRSKKIKKIPFFGQQNASAKSAKIEKDDLCEGLCLLWFRCYDHDMDRALGQELNSPVFRRKFSIVDAICQLQNLPNVASSAMEQTKGDTDNENNADWILDSLVAYLRGPIWNTPILNFIEQKSVGMKQITDIVMYPIHLPVA